MAKDTPASEPAFDLTTITAREMQNFFRAARENDIDTLAKVFARVCTGGLGDRDPADPATYLEMPFYGEFQTMLTGLVAAAKKLASG